MTDSIEILLSSNGRSGIVHHGKW